MKKLLFILVISLLISSCQPTGTNSGDRISVWEYDVYQNGFKIDTVCGPGRG